MQINLIIIDAVNECGDSHEKSFDCLVLILLVILPFLASSIKDSTTPDNPNQISSEPGSVKNASTMTLCAEDDNINVPLYSKNLTAFKITATHPAYIPTNVNDQGFNCSIYCKNCFVPYKIPYVKVIFPPENVIENVIIQRVNPSDLPQSNSRGMNVSVIYKNEVWHEENVTTLRIYKRIDGTSSDYPQVFILYSDGNARIKPQAPCCLNDTTFGSSVIIGANDLGTQHVEIDSVVIDPLNLSMDIEYRDNASAHIRIQVNRSENIVEVSNITYDTISHPFARFRSMRVTDGNSDVDHIRTKEGETHIMGGWKQFNGTWWQFFRKVPSIHNTYSPDIKIEIIPNLKGTTVQSGFEGIIAVAGLLAIAYLIPNRKR